MKVHLTKKIEPNIREREGPSMLIPKVHTELRSLELLLIVKLKLALVMEKQSGF
jgi:hypothetical protein